MKQKSTNWIAGVLILGFLLLLSSAAPAATTLNYQGRVASGGVVFTGSGQFKFALLSVDGTTAYWKNDGAVGVAEPTTAVTLTVTKGLFSVLLGDSTLGNMSPIDPTAFASAAGAILRIWFNDGTKGWQQLTPDQIVSYSALVTLKQQAGSGGFGAYTSVTTNQILFASTDGFLVVDNGAANVNPAIIEIGQASTSLNIVYNPGSGSSFHSNPTCIPIPAGYFYKVTGNVQSARWVASTGGSAPSVTSSAGTLKTVVMTVFPISDQINNYYSLNRGASTGISNVSCALSVPFGLVDSNGRGFDVRSQIERTVKKVVKISGVFSKTDAGASVGVRLLKVDAAGAETVVGTASLNTLGNSVYSESVLNETLSFDQYSYFISTFGTLVNGPNNGVTVDQVTIQIIE